MILQFQGKASFLVSRRYFPWCSNRFRWLWLAKSPLERFIHNQPNPAPRCPPFIRIIEVREGLNKLKQSLEILNYLNLRADVDPASNLVPCYDQPPPTRDTWRVRKIWLWNWKGSFLLQYHCTFYPWFKNEIYVIKGNVHCKFNELLVVLTDWKKCTLNEGQKEVLYVTRSKGNYLPCLNSLCRSR